MPIRDLCTKKLVGVERGASIQIAADLMRQHNVGGVVVFSSFEKKDPIGILTDRDIAVRVVAENLPLSTAVEKAMSTDVVKVKANAGMAEVVEKMESEEVRRVLVVDDSGKICGLVSTDDLLSLIAREMNGLGNLINHQLATEQSVSQKSQSFY